MALTYTPISSIILAANTSSLTFSNIPSTYSNLIISSTVAGDGVLSLVLNNNTNDIYSRVFFAGNATSAFSTTSPGDITASAPSWSIMSISDTPQQMTCEIFAANATDKYKINLAQAFETGASELVVLTAGQANLSSAVTDITILSALEISAGSIFSLYGVEA